MDLKDLILIYTRHDKEGNRRYRRLDTGEEIFNASESIEMLPEPAAILLPHKSKLVQINHRDRKLEANALLLGMKIQYQGLICRLVNYCILKDY